MPRMQRFELSPNNMTRLLTREPLLIVRLSILKPGLPNTMRPWRQKPYKDHTFALCIPLELDEYGFESHKLEHISWSCLQAHARWRFLQILPSTPFWESLAQLHLHESNASFSQMISSEMDHIELAFCNLLRVLINLDFIICILTW
jgi:hypothetical protein